MHLKESFRHRAACKGVPSFHGSILGVPDRYNFSVTFIRTWHHDKFQEKVKYGGEHSWTLSSVLHLKVYIVEISAALTHSSRLNCELSPVLRASSSWETLQLKSFRFWRYFSRPNRRHDQCREPSVIKWNEPSFSSWRTGTTVSLDQLIKGGRVRLPIPLPQLTLPILTYSDASITHFNKITLLI